MQGIHFVSPHRRLMSRLRRREACRESPRTQQLPICAVFTPEDVAKRNGQSECPEATERQHTDKEGGAEGSRLEKLDNIAATRDDHSRDAIIDFSNGITYPPSQTAGGRAPLAAVLPHPAPFSPGKAH